MTGSSERDDAEIAAGLSSLDPGARSVLAVLAVVGRASLSVDELGEIAEVSDAQLAVAELERRGLVVREDDRSTAAAGMRGRLKRLLASADVSDRVLRGFIHIAEDGRLTLDDLDAVVELTRIAAETGRWAQLLRLAEAAQTTLSTKQRLEDWREILERQGEAARAEGDGGARERAGRGLDRLRRNRIRRTTLSVLAAAGAIGVGVAAGYLVGEQSSGESMRGTVTETTTAAGETVTQTATATATVTETVTTTTTTTVPPPEPPQGGIE